MREPTPELNGSIKDKNTVTTGYRASPFLCQRAYRQEGPTGQRGLLVSGGGFGPGGLPLGYAPVCRDMHFGHITAGNYYGFQTPSFFGDYFFRFGPTVFKFSHTSFQPKRRFLSIWSVNKKSIIRVLVIAS